MHAYIHTYIHTYINTYCPLCPYCNLDVETTKHIFWECSSWTHIRQQYPQLMRLYSIFGSQWPECFLHCGWVEIDKDYGLQTFAGLGTPYQHQTFVLDTHSMYLQLLVTRHDASKVLRSIPQTPPIPLSSLPPSSPILISHPDDVSPVSVQSSHSG